MGILVDLLAITRRKGSVVPSRTIILMLIPMFLILSSSVYPSLMSSTENKEMLIISNVMVKLSEINTESSNNHPSTMAMPSSEELVPPSPTPRETQFANT